jgi:hypothetical protein
MSFGYPQLYANGLNSNSQIRRSADFVYQRGGTYEVILTGSTLEPSIELVVKLYSDDNLVGGMALVPFETGPTDYETYYYKFGIRPYQYLQNYVETEHYQYYWKDDFDSTTQLINVDAPYPNGIKTNIQYGYRFLSGGTYNYEYTGGTTTTNAELINLNDYNHFTYLPESYNSTGFTPSDYVSTGKYFDYIGGTFQFNNNLILQNFDQEVGTNIGTGFTADTISLYNRLSPIGQYLMDYPTVPEQSVSGRFLTSSPRIQFVQSSENYVLYYLNGQTGDRQVIEADWATFEFYDVNNNQIAFYNQELNKSGTIYESPIDNTDTLRKFALPCGPQDISNLFTGVTWTNVAYYRVQLSYGLPTWNVNRLNAGPIGPISELFYFYLYDNCLPESTRLVWLNEQGGYDYYTFQSYRQDSKKITRQTYDNRYYATNLNSPDRNIARTTKTFDTDIEYQIVLESDYLSVSQAQWIEGLFTSPQVYIMENDFISPIDRQDKIYKSLNPIQITSTDVDTITKKHKKLNKYRITVKTADSFFVNKGF